MEKALRKTQTFPEEWSRPTVLAIWVVGVSRLGPLPMEEAIHHQDGHFQPALGVELLVTLPMPFPASLFCAAIGEPWWPFDHRQSPQFSLVELIFTILVLIQASPEN